jgi:hypothetical protein
VTELEPLPGATAAPAAETSEASSLARLMAGYTAKMARYYQTTMQGTADEAAAFAWGPADDDRMARTLDAPGEQLDWWALGQLAERDPDAALLVWARVRGEARDELDSGHRAAEALDIFTRPWERARFLAVRSSFRDEWRPRGGIEDALIDTLAHTYIEQLDWLRTMHARTQLDEVEEEGPTMRLRRPHVSADAVAARDEAALMIDRFNRLFTRTLRALGDHRRRPVVMVQNAEQVNVAQQQVNVATSTSA